MDHTTPFCKRIISNINETKKIIYDRLSDAELIELLRSNDQNAFNHIFGRYSRLLYKYAYSRLGDREQAKDLIQTLFTNLWERRSTINISGQFRSYIYVVLRNRIIDHYKHKRISQRYIDSFQYYLTDIDEATDHLIRHKNLSTLIDREIALLPKSMREVFELSRNSYYSRREIAERLNISEIAVKNRMHRALEILRKSLGDLIIFL